MVLGYLVIARVLTWLFTSNVNSGNYLLRKFLLQFALDRGFFCALCQVVMQNFCVMVRSCHLLPQGQL